ncbi:peptidoglycan DD-metalloendopeptidase family protein [Streptomyces sp. NBC_00233]|uniref:peptidoglycan DD-metalloendopeptidase family protein n=1 Tax=Streptomyces sp. NBC_00233 TaxID=2975686 RepID=UPI00225465CC|nr:peptidoglycan DD-metalloendopeptidase family protein [Streptomyces sp. NBC_00233]MCX5232887.1 peptidoglycan DD-metalloendopeptidase family protein [Streptomyces sp. NBC_00233]
MVSAPAVSATLRSLHRDTRTVASTLIAVLLLGLLSAVPAQAAVPDWPLLQKGATGNNVASLQFLLRQQGGSLTANAEYDAQTRSAVISYQLSQGLTADGIVGPATWSRFVVLVAPGSTQANAIRALQFQLRKHGYVIAADGVFGEQTSAAVLDYKAQHQLTGGTAVGITTWQHLLGSPPGSGPLGAYAFVIPRTAVFDGRESLLWPHHDYPAADIAVETGTPAYAITSGTARLNGGLGDSCGLGVAIDGDDGVSYQYCHLDRRDVGNGARVTAGQLVAHTGNTGNSTGPHLHFGIFRQGVSVCPQQLLLALYDGVIPPSPWALPATGCTS